MATVATGMLVENAAMFLSVRQGAAWHAIGAGAASGVLFGVGVLPLHLVILLAGIGLAGAFLMATRATPYGKALLAVVQNPRAA